MAERFVGILVQNRFYLIMMFVYEHSALRETRPIATDFIGCCIIHQSNWIDSLKTVRRVCGWSHQLSKLTLLSVYRLTVY